LKAKGYDNIEKQLQDNLSSMLSYIKGNVLAKTQDFAIIKTKEDVGYKVRLKPIDFSCLKEKEDLELYLYSHIKEDAFDLFGFKTLEELSFFETIISISGVGPKTGLAILCLGSTSDIKQAIQNKDTSYLTKVSGIGGKTASRVILELQGQLATDILGDNSIDEKEDALCALLELGYRKNEALKALSKVKSSTPEEQVKEALSNL